MLIALIDDGIDLRRCPDICLKDDLIVEPDGILRPRSPGTVAGGAGVVSGKGDPVDPHERRDNPAL